MGDYKNKIETADGISACLVFILLSQVDMAQIGTALLIEHGTRFSRCHSSIEGRNRKG